MRHTPIPPSLFLENPRPLSPLPPPKPLPPAHPPPPPPPHPHPPLPPPPHSPNSLAVVNANDILPTISDGSLPLIPNSDLFYLTGVEQEESILLIAPNAFDETQREILFLRETSELIAIWEGHKLTRDQAREVT